MNKFRSLAGKHPDLFAVCGIVFFTFLIFGRAVPFESCGYDDCFYIGQHELLRLNWTNLRYHFTHPVLRLYSPLAMYSYMVDFALWGPKLLEQGVRIQSLLWHTAGAVFFYGLLRLLRFQRDDEEVVILSAPIAFLTTLFFALHPQRIESVVWLSERKDVLMAALGTAALYFFLKAHRQNRTSIAAPLLLFLSFGAKPMLVTLPCVMALMLWNEERRIDVKLWVKRLVLSVAAVGIYFILNALQLGSSLSGNESWSLRILRSLWNTGNCFIRVYLPCDLQTVYPLFDLRTASLWRGIALLSVILLLAVLGAFRKRCRASLWFGVLPCLLAYTGTFFPVSGIVAIGNVDCADRYSYFPSLFLCILLGFIVQLLHNNLPRYRKIVMGLYLFYAAVIALQTVFQLDSWKSFRHYLASALDSEQPSRAVLWLASGLAVDDKDEEQLQMHLEQLRRTAPHEVDRRLTELFAVECMGILRFRQQRPEEGIKFLRKVYADPDWRTLQSRNHGLLREGLLFAATYHHQHKDKRNAAILFRMAAEVAGETDVIESEFYRGLSSLLQKNLDAAEMHFLNARRYAPNDPNIQANLQTVRMLKMRAAQQKEAVKK